MGEYSRPYGSVKVGCKEFDMWKVPRQPYNVYSIRLLLTATKEKVMSRTNPQQQEGMNQQYANLNGKDKAEFLLASIIGRQIGDKWLELIESAMLEYVTWHNKQHANFQTCEYCEDVKNNMIMYSGMKHWVEVFNNTTNKK